MISSRFRMVASVRHHKCIDFISSLNFSLGKNYSHSNNDGDQAQRSEQENDEVTSDDKHIKPDLSVITDNKPDSPPTLKTVSVIPGKGKPPEPPVTCCMTGCANCVWIAYAEELKAYYGDGGEMARKALDHIEDPSLKAFIKFELGIKG